MTATPEVSDRAAALSAAKRLSLRSQRLRAGASVTGTPAVIAARPPDHGDPPLSYAQERLWFMEQYVPGTAAEQVGAPRTGAGAVTPVPAAIRPAAPEQAARDFWHDRWREPAGATLPELPDPLDAAAKPTVTVPAAMPAVTVPAATKPAVGGAALRFSVGAGVDRLLSERAASVGVALDLDGDVSYLDTVESLAGWLSGHGGGGGT